MQGSEPFIELPPPPPSNATKTRLTKRRPLEVSNIDERPTKKSTDTPSIYETAKKLFHRSAQVRMVGRTTERAAITRFWNRMVDDGRFLLSGSDESRVLYICGNPGTGKTALINEMLPELIDEISEEVKIFKGNCMMHADPREILSDLALYLGIKLKKPPKNVDKWSEICNQIEAHLAQLKKGFVMLVLDEVDQISTKDNHLLTRIFRWPFKIDSKRISIIGIANSLDLSFRCLDLPPENVSILNFSPYSVEDISRILMARLELANEIGKENQSTPKIISPIAIELCSRKVSSVGDLRKALEIMRDSICLAERESLANSTLINVEIKHVVKSMEQIFGMTVRTASRNVQLIQELNLHQKVFLATLHRLLKDSSSLKPTVQTLFDRYSSNVRLSRIIEGISRSEFNDLVSNTESMGIITLIAAGKRSKGTDGHVSPDTKICLSMPLSDINTALLDNPVIKQLL